MDYPTETKAHPGQKAVRDLVIELLRSRNRKARFMTELYAALEKAGVTAAEADRVLSQLESESLAMVRDHFCADPHLAGIDLRVATIVETGDGGEDAQLSAIRRIDEAWNKWLNEYLANHRCG